MKTAPRVRRVLLTADTVGGVWTFALELAGSLAAVGTEVILAAMGGDPSEDQRTAAQSIPNLRLFARNYRLEWMEDPWPDVEKAAKWLLDLEARFAPEVIHLNSYVHGSIGWQAPVVMTAHSCVFSWWRAVHGEDPPSEWARYKHEVARGLSAATLVTAPSRVMLHAIERHYGPVANGSVIPNGRAPRHYSPGRKEPVVLTAGRLWDRAKNVAIFESIAASLDWPVYLAGECRHPDGGGRDVACCRLLGQLNPAELSQWYSRAGIYALPARYEPFGLSALEAALSGCALILGDIPSLREVWQDAAVFVSPDDVRAWESELNRLIRHPRLREEMSRRAIARGRQFTPERTARAYLACYAEAVQQREFACAS